MISRDNLGRRSPKCLRKVSMKFLRPIQAGILIFYISKEVDPVQKLAAETIQLLHIISQVFQLRIESNFVSKERTTEGSLSLSLVRLSLERQRRRPIVAFEARRRNNHWKPCSASRSFSREAPTINLLLRVMVTSTEKAETVVQSRCVTHKINEMFDSVNVAPHYMEAIDRTPFGHLWHVKDITMERSLLHFIASNWDCTKCGAKLNGRILPFRSVDVALVLGVNNHGTPVDIYHNPGPTQEYERLFGRYRVKVPLLVEAFKRLVGSGGK
ncbi:hypothetical protein H6P81_020623 [Aristolochia fimbriata]|uniref:Uncharacterized protein n=1 Tax=Aristolochia fimbriata TaxID=158543 RepID=A0AAV7DVW7_ARIFI|nr:hypothetical protein H6P81_020623 [Aristolochia fimbriata]